MHFTVIHALEVICMYRVCMVGMLQMTHYWASLPNSGFISRKLGCQPIKWWLIEEGIYQLTIVYRAYINKTHTINTFCHFRQYRKKSWEHELSKCFKKVISKCVTPLYSRRKKGIWQAQWEINKTLYSQSRFDTLNYILLIVRNNCQHIYFSC